MSGVDPLAALAASQAQVLLNDVALALDAATLALDAKLGDVLQATVLPPQNGSDLLQIAGQVVHAQLPPGIEPGQALALKVTEITPERILVTNLGVLPQEPDSRGLNPVSPQLQAKIPFVPAAVREIVIAPVIPARSYQPPPIIPTILAAELPLVEQSGLEARMAAQATRGNLPLPPDPAIAPDASTPGQVSAAPSAPQGTVPPPVAPAGIPITLSAVSQRFLIAPEIFERMPLDASGDAPGVHIGPGTIQNFEPVAAGQRGVDMRGSDLTEIATLRSGSPPVITDSPGVRLAPEVLLGQRPSEPGALVRILSGAFEKLEAALAQTPPQENDPATSTVRTMLSFIGRLDPRNLRALPEQIAAFVSHVIEGPEPKLAALARYAPPAQQFTAEPTLEDASSQARSASQNVALTHDLKTALAAIITRSASPTPLVVAATEALNAMTSTQLGTLAANASNPSVITFAIPLAYADGTTVAHLQVSRDGKQSREPLDAANFHIAFVLETKNLGIIAIDMQTTGRSVQLAVKTERASFSGHVTKTLAGLRDRLEMLRYTVASAAAAVAARPTVVPETKAVPGTRPSASTVDMQA